MMMKLVLGLCLCRGPICQQSHIIEQDNKNRWIIGMCAYLVKQGLVGQVELVMLMVGHTHEGRTDE